VSVEEYLDLLADGQVGCWRAAVHEDEAVRAGEGNGVGAACFQHSDLFVDTPGGEKPCNRTRHYAFQEFSAMHSNSRNDAGAVAELVALNPGLLQYRQVEIRDGRALRQDDVLANELDFSIAATYEDIRFRIVVMQIAVAHVRPVHEHRVVEQTSRSIRSIRPSS